MQAGRCMWALSMYLSKKTAVTDFTSLTTSLTTLSPIEEDCAVVSDVELAAEDLQPCAVHGAVLEACLHAVVDHPARDAHEWLQHVKGDRLPVPVAVKVQKLGHQLLLLLCYPLAYLHRPAAIGSCCHGAIGVGGGGGGGGGCGVSSAA